MRDKKHNLCASLCARNLWLSLAAFAMNYFLSTTRLELRPVQIGNVELFHELCADTHVRHFLFDERVISVEEARAIVEQSVRSFEERGYGLWLVFSRESAKLIGFGGLLQSSDESPNLIYGVHPDFWGNGFATEAAKALLDFAFDTLGLDSVKADVDEPNVMSVRILEKLGMRQIRRAIVAGRPLLYYEQHRNDPRQWLGEGTGLLGLP